MKISTSDFNTGLTIEMDGEVYTIVDYQHSKSGRGGAFVRTKLKNVENGNIVKKTFQSGDKVSKAYVEKKPYQYLYRDGDDYIFMDKETYEQIPLREDDLGDGIKYLKDNMDLKLLIYEGRPIGIDLPTFVELAVAQAAPSIRGDTVSGGTKRAKLETGLEVQVPLFIEPGDILKVDTRTGEYIERIN